jgi:hypothetical protein
MTLSFIIYHDNCVLLLKIWIIIFKKIYNEGAWIIFYDSVIAQYRTARK